MKILIIDDDPLHLSSLETSLSVRGYDCRSYLSPVSAIDAYRNGDFDVVITAVKMLGISGEEVLESILGIDPEAKVILITGFDDIKIDPGARKGIFGFFRKPVVIEELIEKIERIEKAQDYSN